MSKTAGEGEVEWLEQVLLRWVEWAAHVPGLSYVVRYIASMLHHDPWRLFLEFVLFIIFLRFIFGKRYKPAEKYVKLTKKEVDDLIAEWTPEPLVPLMNHRTARDLKATRVIQGHVGVVVKVDGVDMLNFASYNFLGLIGHPQIEEVAQKTLRTHGVGSCGPPGFYGTIDTHMELEQKLAQFFGTPEAILYSFGFSTIASTIPAFAKRGDLLVCDEGIDFALQKGVIVSRAQVKTFKHNDMEDLERILKDVCQNTKKGKPLNRRFIVVEGLYQNYADLCPLSQIIELKNKYKFRLILDETYSFGILGKTGRGVSEHFNVPVNKIDILTGSLSTGIGGAGGFCVGATPVVDHQRLSGQGYCFSASMPAMLAASAIESLKILQQQPDRLVKLKENIAIFHKLAASGMGGLEIIGNENSPIILARLKQRSEDREKEEDLLQAIVDKCGELGVYFVRGMYVIEEETKAPIANIRITISQSHDQQQITKAVETLRQAAHLVLKE